MFYSSMLSEHKIFIILLDEIVIKALVLLFLLFLLIGGIVLYSHSNTVNVMLCFVALQWHQHIHNL